MIILECLPPTFCTKCAEMVANFPEWDGHYVEGTLKYACGTEVLSMLHSNEGPVKESPRKCPSCFQGKHRLKV